MPGDEFDVNNKPMKELDTYTENYRSTAAINDAIWRGFGERTDSVPFLKVHRDWVEDNAWGFGDRAFHYMWYLLLRDSVLDRPSPELLEVGVYKGQVISLWALIAAHLGRDVAITAVSPFEGNKPWFAKRRITSLIAKLAVRRYRDDVHSINLYEKQDYQAAVRHIFANFDFSTASLSMLRGYSQDAQVQRRLAQRSFDLIYIDGGHRYEEVVKDLNFYPALVKAGGYFVLDDASSFEPGSEFWKGIESVSRAVTDWGAPGFSNVLNVGHNRVYQRKSG
jgi:hypothetical protein